MVKLTISQHLCAKINSRVVRYLGHRAKCLLILIKTCRENSVFFFLGNWDEIYTRQSRSRMDRMKNTLPCQRIFVKTLDKGKHDRLCYHVSGSVSACGLYRPVASHNREVYREIENNRLARERNVIIRFYYVFVLLYVRLLLIFYDKWGTLFIMFTFIAATPAWTAQILLSTLFIILLYAEIVWSLKRRPLAECRVLVVFHRRKAVVFKKYISIKTYQFDNWCKLFETNRQNLKIRWRTDTRFIYKRRVTSVLKISLQNCTFILEISYD